MDQSPAGRRPVTGLVLLGVCALVLASMAAPVAGQSGGSDAGPFALAQTQVDADAVLLSVALRPDGTAGWRIEYRVRLDDENATRAFESLQRDVDANASAYVSRFGSRMRPTVKDAAAATGREMALRDVQVSTTTQQLPQAYGVLVYTFEWTNFAAVEGDRLRAGDALAGLFLDADSVLLLSWPDGYSMVEVSPSPTEERERSVLWRGPTDFGPGEPKLVVSSGGGPTTDETSILGVAVVAVVLLGGVMWWWRRSGRGGDTPATATGGGASRPPDDLLSNEERVVAVLEEHGGRMKQQALVEVLGWTDAKTSQVVSVMRESGQLEGFRLGRENVLRLPSEDDSPVDEEDEA